MPPVCIDPAQLRDRLEEVAVIDVRTPGEFETAHLPSSSNRPLEAIADHHEEIRHLVESGREVVLLCRSGARAHQAQERLEALGVPDLPIVEGGIVAWEADGGPIVREVLRWDLERQVRLVAGSLVAASIAASVVFPPARFVAGAVGAGLVVAATTNTCAMGVLLSKLPYNRARASSTV